MKRNILTKVILMLFFSILMGSAQAGGSAWVSSGANDGPGSLRAALNEGANVIRFSRSVQNVVISEPLVYSAAGKLRLFGTGQTIDGSALAPNDDILTVAYGADLIVKNLNLIGNSGEINMNASAPEGGKGIFVAVPTDRTGLVRVTLNNVSVSRVGNHGVHISDCTLGDDCGSGSGGGGDGSPASIYLIMQDVLIDRVGFGKADADGVRVDDRGDGSIYFLAKNSTFINVGADGVELDEGNDGSVVALVEDSLFDRNGEYCSLIPFVAGSPCDDDGDPDVDDGFDVDEAGAGGLYARIQDSRISNNFDEGLDFDEEDEGGIEVELKRVFATGNEDEGVKLSEEDTGDVRVYMEALTSVDNNGSKEGIEIEETNQGDVEVFVRSSNLIGADDEALKIEQADEGSGTVTIRRSIIDSLDLEGVVEL